jgi:murein L,D-transpeptidase YafK
LKDDVVIKSYRVAFGSSPFGHKQFEGDQKTPEGIYNIDSKNPESKFYKALHVSYPNKQDREFAKSKGRSAGGDIMVHGLPVDPNKRALVEFVHPGYNWTAGCIAVTDAEIDELYKMVDRGVTIEICKMTPTPLPPPIDTGEGQEDGSESGGGSIYLPGK